MDFIESYNQTELSIMEGKNRKRIGREKINYIPVKIVTAQSRATAKGYTIRYVRNEDIKEFLADNKPILKKKKTISKVKKKKFSGKFKKKL